MPFYEYECSNCKFYVEAMQKISDEPLKKCPSCGESTLVRLISAPVFRLKGGGWYETDFKGDKESKRNLSGGDTSEGDSKASKDRLTKTKADKTKADKPQKAQAPVAAAKAKKPAARTSKAKKPAAKGKRPAAKARKPATKASKPAAKAKKTAAARRKKAPARKAAAPRSSGSKTGKKKPARRGR